MGGLFAVDMFCHTGSPPAFDYAMLLIFLQEQHMQDFEGKVAVITGAASGIGRALTEKCLAEGMHVVMADIESKALHQAAKELQAAGQNSILPVKTDVAILDEIENLKQKAVDTFGGVHLLFNNAGVGGGGNAWNSTQKDWEWVLGVNLWSVIHGLRVFVPQMIAQNTPCHIVNTASVAGLLGGTTNAAYSVTKHGVVAITENLVVDLQAESLQIGASVLCPGLIDTNIMDSGRNRPAALVDSAEPVQLTAEQEVNRDQFAAALKQGMQPAEVAEIVFAGIRADRLYIQTHDLFNGMLLERANNIAAGTNPKALKLF
jgi:NAD(P)-dependent dehydrogenase (short-subunit alcohol dehydrogenase family)